jgi:hypothetical protein
MAVVGWLARWLGSRLESWARLALVCTLSVPVVVEPQIKSFEGGERHVAMVRILASLEMGMARTLGSSNLCLAVGTYAQGTGDSHAGRPGSDARK